MLNIFNTQYRYEIKQKAVISSRNMSIPNVTGTYKVETLEDAKCLKDNGDVINEVLTELLDVKKNVDELDVKLIKDNDNLADFPNGTSSIDDLLAASNMCNILIQNEGSKSQAQRMREYRARKKLRMQSGVHHDILGTNQSPQNDISKFRGKTAAQRAREYRVRKKLRAKTIKPEIEQASLPSRETSAERTRRYRDRKKIYSQSTSDIPEIVELHIQNTSHTSRKTSAERTRRYRARKKLESQVAIAVSEPIQIPRKTSAERTRRYRARKKMESEGISDVSEISESHRNCNPNRKTTERTKRYTERKNIQIQAAIVPEVVGIRGEMNRNTSAERTRRYTERKNKVPINDK